MKTKIALDVKSLLLGAAAATLIIFGTGATGGNSAPGRFEARGVSSDGKVVLWDTQTGQSWTAIINANGNAVGSIGSPSFLTPKAN